MIYYIPKKHIYHIPLIIKQPSLSPKFFQVGHIYPFPPFYSNRHSILTDVILSVTFLTDTSFLTTYAKRNEDNIPAVKAKVPN